MAAKIQFVTNAGALASRKRLLADQVQSNLRAAAKDHAEKMRAKAIQLSSGSLSTAQLKQKGHPYARRFPIGFALQPDFLINAQAGAFKAAWHTRVQETSKGWTITLFNTSPEAKFMMGTKAMRMRPILIEVERLMNGDLPGRVQKVTRKAGQENAAGGSALGAIFYGIGVGLSSAAGGLSEAAGE